MNKNKRKKDEKTLLLNTQVKMDEKRTTGE